MNQQRGGLQEEIRKLTEPQLRASSSEQLAASLAEKYRIDLPILDDSNPTPGRREVDIDITHSHQRAILGGPAVAKGAEITISVPFKGDAEVFRLHPSSHTMSYPRARISDSDITFRWRGTTLDPAHIRREFDQNIATIKQHLAGMPQEMGKFNEVLKTEAASAINARLEKLKRDNDLLPRFRCTKESSMTSDSQFAETPPSSTPGGKYIRGALNAVGGAIPFAGGIFSAISGAWSESEQERVNSFFAIG
jgi:hypothetical protein